MHHRAVAACDLRLPLDDFWRITPRELAAFHRRHTQAREYEEWLTGILASVIANFSFSPPKKPLTPQDFGLGPKLKRALAGDRALTSEQSAHELCNAFRISVGKPILPVVASLAKQNAVQEETDAE